MTNSRELNELTVLYYANYLKRLEEGREVS